MGVQHADNSDFKQETKKASSEFARAVPLLSLSIDRIGICVADPEKAPA